MESVDDQQLLLFAEFKGLALFISHGLGCSLVLVEGLVEPLVEVLTALEDLGQ